MSMLLAAVFGASLVGSVHCAGMCGGFVAFCAGDAAREGRRKALTVHAAYNLGRLAAYAGLGAAAGMLGSALDLTGAWLLGVQRVAAVASGVLIATWGAVTLLEALGVRVPRPGLPLRARRAVARTFQRIADSPPVGRGALIGVLSGCLPCAWLYAFVVTAAGTGSAAAGAVLMGVFWLGTLPMMLGLGLGLRALAVPFRRHVPVACAVAMIAVGSLAIAGRLRPIEPPVPAPASTAPVPAPSGHAHR